MSGGTILVVDDDSALLSAITAALRLRMPDIGVHTAESGTAALDRVVTTDYEVVVSDIKMPGMDGIALLTEIRRLRPDVPTLLITGHGQHDLAVQALRAGAFDFIQKPLDREYFLASLSRAMQVRRLRRQIEGQRRALEAHAAILEMAVEERTSELREANDAKDEFLAMLAHELRNPLATVRSAVDWMMNRGEPSSAEVVDILDGQVSHMTRLLVDLLDVSRIHRDRIVLARQRLDLGGVVQHAVKAVQKPIDDGGYAFSCRLDGHLLPVHGDPTRLEQVIVNLLTNAVKYTDPGGSIRLSVQREGGDAVVRVQDGGIGISAELLPRVFEPFTQADRSLARSRGGLGLGLTLVQRLVELHGGTVAASSPGEGQGSTFIVRLPLMRDCVEPVEEALIQPVPPRRRRVLLVDDNQAVAQITGLLLEDFGHEVVAIAHDGPSAIEAALRHRPEVVLLDIGLPKMSGYEVAQQLRANAELKDMTLVALTGYGQEEDRRKSREAGFDHHLVKPVAVQTLQSLLAEGRERAPEPV